MTILPTGARPGIFVSLPIIKANPFMKTSFTRVLPPRSTTRSIAAITMRAISRVGSWDCLGNLWLPCGRQNDENTLSYATHQAISRSHEIWLYLDTWGGR